MKKTMTIAGLSLTATILYSQLTDDQIAIVDDAKVFKNMHTAEQFEDQFENEEEVEQFVNTLNYNEYVKQQKKNNKEHLSFVEFLSVIDNIKDDTKNDVSKKNDTKQELKSKRTRGLK